MRRPSNVLPLAIPLTLPVGVTTVPGISGAQQLAVGDEHARALHGSGRVVCWGTWRGKEEE